ALCQTLGAVLLVVGLLRVPAIAGEPGAGPRLVLDGVLIAACAVQIGWTLAAEPALVRSTALRPHDPRIFLFGIPLLTALTAVGIAGVAARRAPRPRRALALCAASIAGAALAGLGLLV